jgi:hypothetical protein
MKKFKTSSHLTGANGQPIASGSIVEASQLGDDATVKRYTDLGVIAAPTKEELAAAEDAPAVGGSVVAETSKEAESEAKAAAAKDAEKADSKSK